MHCGKTQTAEKPSDGNRRARLQLVRDLDSEKKENTRLQTLFSQLAIVQEEKIQLRNEVWISALRRVCFSSFASVSILQLNYVKSHNQELEQQLTQVMKLLEHEHERHKKFVVLLVNERKIENEQHKEQLKQLSNNRNK